MVWLIVPVFNDSYKEGNVGGVHVGGAVASWFVRSSTDRAVRVRALAGDTVLCSWARHFTLTVPLSTPELVKSLNSPFFPPRQSLNSPFFPPHTGAEPGRAKGETLLSPVRVQPLLWGGKKGDFRDWTIPEYKWVPLICWGNLTNCWGVTCDGLASRPGGVEILLAASCYGNRDKLRPDEPVGSLRLHSLHKEGML